ncbi:MAG TPA: AraC family transcriptional regulator [Candidatus Limiplasma sp.]|nr:AraC family transcriptional regulator [Candidatus Limiplasma sp.]HRX08080.1 AraC family transcriptional regulator [Candidatus Limiplasma sp.]
MKWINRLNQCIDYIEDHLEDEIDTGKLCEIACLSRKYFFGLFEAACGISCSNYIRNRRLSRAAVKLQGGMKVIDAAFVYGYQSSESFSRAFKEFHGISPSAVARSQAQLRSYSRLVFQIKIVGADTMLYRIEDKGPFTLAGQSIITRNTESNNEDIPKLWTRLIESGAKAQLDRISTSGKAYGACFSVTEADQSFRYAVAAIVEQEEASVPGTLERYAVPGGKWAIFPAKGKIPEVFGGLWNSILSEWLPSHEYEFDHTRPDIENYLDAGVEIWLPIQ